MKLSLEKISNQTILLCDSESSINWAFKNGLTKDIKIISSASSILSNETLNSDHLEKNWCQRRINLFQHEIRTTSELVSNLFSEAEDSKTGNNLLAASIFNQSTKYIYKAACLTPENLKQDKIIIEPIISGTRDKGLRSPFIEILKNDPNTEVLYADIGLEEFTGTSIVGVSKKRRLLLSGVEGLLYKFIIQKGFAHLFKPKFHKTVALFNPNELTQEIAAWLLLSGYSFKQLKVSQELEEMVLCYSKIIWEKLENILYVFIKNWVDIRIFNTCTNILLDEIKTALKKKLAFEKLYSKILDNSSYDFLLTGALNSIEGRALSSTFSKLNVPIISCHHGITHEICDAVSILEHSYDDALCDLTVLHTDEAINHLEKRKHKRGKRIVAGLPARALRLKSIRSNKSNKAQILYLSTFLRIANLSSPLVSPESDWSRDIFETNIVEKVFEKVEHLIDFKPYPEENRRYTEPSSATQKANRAKNINVLHTVSDARFVLPDYSLIIMSGATSTLGWAMAAKKPLIFIDWSGNLPLKKSAVEDFKNALFYFDGDNQDFLDDLKNFLTNSVKDINLLWNDKQQFREEYFFGKYISKFNRNNAREIVPKVKDFVSDFHCHKL